MENAIVYLGIDVDDNSFTCVGVDRNGMETLGFKTKSNAEALIKKIQKLNCSQLKCCYETTYLGFSLARSLRKANIDCVVVAASLIPDMPSDFVKTDRLDAQKLALYLSKGLLTEVRIPDQLDETVAHLTRLRKSIQSQVKDSRLRLQSECRVFDISPIKIPRYNESTRTKVMLEINAVKYEPHREILLLQVSYIFKQFEQLQNIENQIANWSQHERYRSRNEALSCLRGIKTLTAMTLISEIGDVHRFSHPNKLVSYLGLDIKEYSSGGREKKFGITKMGSKRLRTAVVESCQVLPKSSVARPALRQSRRNLPAAWIQVAEKHDARIYNKSRRLMMRGLHGNKIKVACARETVGFIWEMLKTVDQKDGSLLIKT
jgi:transposase